MSNQGLHSSVVRMKQAAVDAGGAGFGGGELVDLYKLFPKSFGGLMFHTKLRSRICLFLEE